MSLNRLIIILLSIDGCETFIPYADEYPVVVQFYNLESWYTLSADGFTQEIANMICRENNHAQGAMNFITRNRSSEDYPIFPYKHLCGGVYETLCECPFGENPTGDQIVMIQCHPQGNLYTLDNFILKSEEILRRYRNGLKNVINNTNLLL